jgi:cytochrome P450
MVRLTWPAAQTIHCRRTHVVVSTEKIANDLMRERGTLYSDREQLPMAAQLLSDNLCPLFLPYDSLWRKGRKLMHHLNMTSAATSYQPVQLDESTRFSRDLIRDPKSYERYLERYAAGLIMRLAFGQTVYTGNEPSVRRILGVVHTVERVGSPGTYIVDLFPSLMYLPSFMAPFEKEGYALHAEELSLFRELRSDVQSRLEKGDPSAVDTFTAETLQNAAECDLTPDQLAYVVGTLFEAGAGTTAAAIMSFLLAMTLHPENFAQLQAELYNIVGDARMPTFEDVSALPYTRACVKETLRWRPVTAGGMPHKLTKDDVYNGSFIAKGTNVHGNQWAIHREDALYPDLETFIPERWLEPSYPTYKEPLTTYPNLQNYSGFGFGRRICPGQNISERSSNWRILHGSASLSNRSFSVTGNPKWRVPSSERRPQVGPIYTSVPLSKCAVLSPSGFIK